MSKFARFFMLCLLTAVPATLPATTLTFDELPYQPVNGLSYMGVTFTFTISGVPSTDAHYDANGPGILTYVQDPSLVGSATGVLQLDFATPTPVIDFGTALDCFECTLTPGVTVQLFDPSLTSIGVFSLNLSPLVSFAEGEFAFSAGTLVSRAVISFDFNDADQFALDNLTYGTTPEPITATLFVIGLVGIGALRRRAYR